MQTAAVHPRVCGEHFFSGLKRKAHVGSSPRVRGTPKLLHRAAEQFRFIPACAGNTVYSSGGGPYISVHPRVCGEHAICPLSVVVHLGSSPRVRGTPLRCRRGWQHRRFIPACAGNTAATRLSHCRKSVHPRVCGEHAFSGMASGRRPGSSPRVRGTPPRLAGGEGHRRFIPACAGNTVAMSWSLAARSVHPRVCGEHTVATITTNGSRGSSPRVRGTRYSQQQTPVWLPVHPRVCGEHAIDGAGVAALAGSSPRVRGTHRMRRLHIHRARFIPACAGNTLHASIKARAEPVHPRVCGEHCIQGIHIIINTGSSPRVRGTHSESTYILPIARFIPACAGNT